MSVVFFRRLPLSVFQLAHAKNLDWQENWFGGFGWRGSGREGSPDTGVGKWKKTSSQLVIINLFIPFSINNSKQQ